jgi:hypothetical protein
LARRDTRKYTDRREYLIAAVHKRRKKIRQIAIEYKGGRCQVCGYNRCSEALEFHHTDSSGKDFSISERGYTRSWIKVQEELDKCQLLCANCHREHHAQVAAPSGNWRMNSGRIVRSATTVAADPVIRKGYGTGSPIAFTRG